MKLIKKLTGSLAKQVAKKANLNSPTATRWFLNVYPPYLGAGVRVQKVDYDKGVIDVCMPLTKLNQNIVGTQFGGSLYSMTDPFFMTLLMQKLGQDYMVWDKSACIDFIKAGKSDVFARFSIDEIEIQTIKELAKDGKAVFRDYELNITDKEGEIVAHVKKTVYIRLRAFSKSKDMVSRF